MLGGPPVEYATVLIGGNRIIVLGGGPPFQLRRGRSIMMTVLPDLVDVQLYKINDGVAKYSGFLFTEISVLVIIDYKKIAVIHPFFYRLMI